MDAPPPSPFGKIKECSEELRRSVRSSLSAQPGGRAGDSHVVKNIHEERPC